MVEMLTGASVAMFATICVLVVFLARAAVVQIQVTPTGDSFPHTPLQCECLPQILLSYGRSYVIHKDLRDQDVLQLDFL